MSTDLSTVVVTPFGHDLHASESSAIAEAAKVANVTACPCGVWYRDGWYTVCDVAPEMIEPEPELSGWTLWAVVDPVESDPEQLRRLTRQEQLEGLANRGIDTWEEYRGER